MTSSKREKTKALKIWEKLVIVVGSDDNEGYYEGRVEDFLNGGIVVNNPIFVKGSTMLRQDLPVTVQVCREDAIYQFASRIRSYSTNNGRRMVLAPPQSMRRIQRRQFVRIQMSADVKYAVIPEAIDWKEWEDSLTWSESHMVDISAGGIQIKTTDKIAQDDLVLMDVDFFREEELPVPVVAVCRRAYSKDGDSFAGLQFLISDKPIDRMNAPDYTRIPKKLRWFNTRHQDKLANVLFRKQVEFRQKGVI
ncbi:hypothetical protein GF377_04225 [candidate division GN15 bacterium]|nr:hypothetical protein [candidate division GN15 bacterium]